MTRWTRVLALISLAACSAGPTAEPTKGASTDAVVEFRLAGEDPGFPLVVERLAGTRHERIGALGGGQASTLRVSVDPGSHQFFFTVPPGYDDQIAVEDSMTVVEVAARAGRVAFVEVSVRERTSIQWEGKSRTYEGVRRRLEVRVEDDLSR